MVRPSIPRLTALAVMWLGIGLGGFSSQSAVAGNCKASWSGAVASSCDKNLHWRFGATTRIFSENEKTIG